MVPCEINFYLWACDGRRKRGQWSAAPPKNTGHKLMRTSVLIRNGSCSTRASELDVVVFESSSSGAVYEFRELERLVECRLKKKLVTSRIFHRLP